MARENPVFENKMHLSILNNNSIPLYYDSGFLTTLQHFYVQIYIKLLSMPHQFFKVRCLVNKIGVLQIALGNNVSTVQRKGEGGCKKRD